MYLDGIKQPSNNGMPFCVWIKGHFNVLTAGSPSRKSIQFFYGRIRETYPYVVLQNILSSKKT